MNESHQVALVVENHTAGVTWCGKGTICHPVDKAVFGGMWRTIHRVPFWDSDVVFEALEFSTHEF